MQLDVCEAVLGAGPSTGPELRALRARRRSRSTRRSSSLQRLLVLTNAQVVEQRNGWGAIAVDMLARRWPQKKLPAAEDARADARRDRARFVRRELSAADLGGALGWRLKRSRETLEELVERGEATARRRRGLALYR